MCRIILCDSRKQYLILIVLQTIPTILTIFPRSILSTLLYLKPQGISGSNFQVFDDTHVKAWGSTT